MKISDNGSEILIDTSSYAPAGYGGSYMDWRIDAACKDIDTDLFFTSDKRYTRTHFREALAFCANCSVQDECRENAIQFGDHKVSVRGGQIPSDYEPETLTLKPKPEPFGDYMWRMYAQNVPSSIMRAASAVADGTHSRLVSEMLDRRLPGPHTATWSAHRTPNHKAVAANSGWLISISGGGDLYGIVIENGKGQRQRVVRHRDYVTLSDDVVTRGLPILVHIPEAYQGI